MVVTLPRPLMGVEVVIVVTRTRAPLYSSDGTADKDAAEQHADNKHKNKSHF